jgi:hypothetical protein
LQTRPKIEAARLKISGKLIRLLPYEQTLQGLLSTVFEGKLRIYSFGASGAPLSQYLVWARYAVGKFKARALVINVVGNDFDESRIEYKSSPGFWYYAPGPDGELHLQLVEYHQGGALSMDRSVMHQIRVRFQPFCWPEGANDL